MEQTDDSTISRFSLSVMGDMFRSATGVSPSTLLPRVDSDSRLLFGFSGVTSAVGDFLLLLGFSGVMSGVGVSRLVGVEGGVPCLRV